MTASETERQEIEELLPWHAAGTLGVEDAQRVEAALADDAELAQRYALVREELAETTALNESLGTPSYRAFNTLMAAIDAEPARTQAPLTAQARGWFARLTEALSPRALTFAGAAAALVIVLQAGVIANLALQDAPYQTATGPGGTTLTRSLGGGTFVLIRFSAQASGTDVARFLADNKLGIVDGPLANGLFRVKLSDTVLPPEEVRRTVRELQASRVVDLVATQ